MHPWLSRTGIVFILWACLFSPAPSQASDADQTAVVDGNNQFAIDLYQNLKNQNGNLFFSPASISTALAMTYAGARGATASEMAQTLHFNLPPDKLHPAMGDLLRGTNSVNTIDGNSLLSFFHLEHGNELHEANALWLQSGSNFSDDFLKLVKDNYAAQLGNLDFGKSAAAAESINHWVEDQTNSKIQNLVQADMLTGAQLVLTNAIYFKGDWQTHFVKGKTEDQDFYVTPTAKVRTPLMHNIEAPFNYFKFFYTQSFKALEMPYKGKDLSMILFLPDKKDGLANFEESITAANLKQWLALLQPQYVNVSIPRFKSTLRFKLKQQLSAMGMRQAFDQGLADFSGMNGKKNLYISDVIHKAYISVDEEGTEAAASTVAVARTSGVLDSAPQLLSFYADHPFIYLIRDNRTGSILFMGRMTDPTQG